MSPFIRTGVLTVIAVAGIGRAEAVVIDRYFTVNPIRVCDDAGANCTTATTYAGETTKIYAQAGVLPVFLPTTQLNKTSALSVPSVSNVSVAGNGQSTDASTLNVWFVQNMPVSSGTLFGEAWLGANGVAINTSAVNSFNSGVGRIDTVAHEIGHNLGLGHGDFGAGGANNVMTAGSVRSIPNGIGNITPDGANLDQFTQDQIDTLRASSFVKVVPKVVVDINGSTPFDTDDFFKIHFQDGPADAYLKSLTIDLRPVGAFFDPTGTPPGVTGSPLSFGTLTGLGAGDITTAGATDGSQILTLTFANGAFKKDDLLEFGIDVDLLSCIDCFGAEPSQLIGALFSFSFSDGFGSTAAMSGTSFLADSTDVVDLVNGVTFDASLLTTPAGFVAPPQNQIDTPDPVPEPASLALLFAGAAALAPVRMRSRRSAHGRR